MATKGANQPQTTSLPPPIVTPSSPTFDDPPPRRVSAHYDSTPSFENFSICAASGSDGRGLPGTSSMSTADNSAMGADFQRADGIVYLPPPTLTGGADASSTAAKYGFELLVIGCGGGPLETNLSSYLLKPYSTPWSDGCTSLEAGSGLGALANLIEACPESFTDFGLENLGIASPSSSGKGKASSVVSGTGVGSVGREGGGRAAGRVWDYIKCFTVSHAHLDHIQGLVISSGATLVPRPLYGTSRTIGNIDRLFDGGVWPRLVGWEDDGVKAGRAYLYRDVPAPTETPLPLSTSMSFHAFPVSHGLDPSNFHRRAPGAKRKSSQNLGADGEPLHECYDSTAFFIKESVTGQGRELLFFGDVEPDSLSKRPLNLPVWKCAAPKIAAGILSTIFLECSYPTSQPADKLWGHLSPPFVAEEMRALSKLVVEARIEQGVSPQRAALLPLAGVTVVIIHIKDDIMPRPAPALTLQRSSPSSSSTSTTTTITPATPTTPSAPAHLTMSPPLPTEPVRRASGGGLPFSGWGFARRASASPTSPMEGRRMSLPQLGAASSVGIAGAPLANGNGFDRLIAHFSHRSKLSDEERQLESMTEVSEGSMSAGPSPVLLQRDASTDGHNQAIDDEEEEEEMEEETVRETIERELNELEEVDRTGVRFLLAEQGMRIAF